MFNKVNQKQFFPELEEKMLKFWKENDIFRKSLDIRKNEKPFVFYEGPPTANGMPGIHHVLARVFKDVITRYKCMQGFYVERKAGWDTHGLPVELQVEKEINVSGKPEIEKFGIEKFNRLCKESVWKYTKAWEEMTQRIGYWVDMENPYVTYKNEYIESIWWALSEMFKKGLLYEGHKIVPYCPRCGTPLSSHEVAQGYKDVTDLTITAKFPAKGEKNTFFLAWTTTPWTLIGNVALTVGPKIDYVKIKAENGENYILAKARLEAYEKELGKYEILEEMKGKNLINMEYAPLYDYFCHSDDKTCHSEQSEAGTTCHSERSEAKSRNLKGWYVVGEDFVTTEDGTGIVHMALYGEDDYNVIKKYDMPRIQHVDAEGKFIPEVKQFEGWSFDEEGLDVEIVKDLASKNLIFSKQKQEHSYPFCWRCDTRLMYFAINSWYIKMTEVKDNLIKNNQKINWYPSHIKNGRFGKWLEEVKDWALSRNRYWGTPLPIWKCECGEVECVGSIKELEEKSGGNIPKDSAGELDLHRPYVDDIKLQCSKCGKDMVRETHVIDCWFDSGAMPFAQNHYPFENKESIKTKFPAQYISEAIDQTRGWFYTLLAISTVLFDETSYKNVICLGHILDEHGKKMSKSKGNVVNPWDILNAQGADACRWYMYNANPPGNSRNFSQELVEKSLRKFMLTLWNTYSFFVTYSNIDKWEPKKDENGEAKTPNSSNKLDKWIISEMNILIDKLTETMDSYDIWGSTVLLEDFLENLSNWYVRRSRKRFWKSENDEDKGSAYQTLYYVLVNFSKMIAPYMPFVSDEIYKNLTGEQSVHLADWPIFEENLIDKKLNKELARVRNIVNLGHSIRAEAKVKVRQPLSTIKVVAPFKLDKEEEKVVLEELNVKNLDYIKDINEIAESVVKPNAKLLGPKYGGKVQEIIKMAKEGKAQVQKDGKIKVGEYVLEQDEAEIVYESKGSFNSMSNKGVVVALDTEITDELYEEGVARDIVRMIQEMRKEADYQVDDRIKLYIQTSDKIKAIIEKWRDYIKKETLAEELSFESAKEADIEKESEMEEGKVKIGLRK